MPLEEPCANDGSQYNEGETGRVETLWDRFRPANKTKLKELISMKCPDCGTNNFSYAEYCRKCQRDLRRASREQIMAKRDRSVFSLRVER